MARAGAARGEPAASTHHLLAPGVPASPRFSSTPVMVTSAAAAAAAAAAAEDAGVAGDAEDVADAAACAAAVAAATADEEGEAAKV